VPKEKCYYVYLLTNWNHRVIYVGFTNDLKRRIDEHQHKLVKGFTEKYNVNKLVYFEETSDVTTAIEREKGDQEVAARKEEWLGDEHESRLERLEPRILRFLSPVEMTDEVLQTIITKETL